MKSYYIYTEGMSDFELSPEHPYRPDRSDKSFELCERYDLLDKPWMSIIPPEPLSDELLLLFHTDKYLNILKNADKSEVTEETMKAGLGTPDNPIFPDMFNKLNLVSGGTYVGTQKVIETNGRAYAFSPVGGFHHAYPDHAEGFCYINDIAVVGKKLRNDGLRIAYIDIDAHHGNGVESAFLDDKDALVISIHQTGKTIYPGTGFETELGSGDAIGTNINIPLPPRTDDELYLKAFYEIVPPMVETFSPDIILAQIGTDTLVNDAIANLSLTNRSYVKVVREIWNMTDKLVSTGGGGYNVDSASRAWTLAWAAVNDIKIEDPYAGIISGVMKGTEIEGGDLSDSPVFVSVKVREKNEKEIDRVIEYLKKNAFPLIGAKG